MIEIHKVGNSICLYDGERCFIIPYSELDAFDNAFYKMKRDIESEHMMVGLIIDGGVSHPTKTIEAQLAEIEADQ